MTQPGPSPVMDRHPDIAHLVTTFYGRAREDAMLGPVFDAVVHDWPGHVRALTAFWAAQLRGRGRYQGQPVAAHRAMANRIAPEMFDRWLALWRVAVGECLQGDEAAMALTKAERIAEVLRGAVVEAR